MGMSAVVSARSSSVQMAIKEDRNAKKLVYGMDNCSGQNKKYTMYTSLVAAVNDPKLVVEKIALQLLEVAMPS